MTARFSCKLYKPALYSFYMHKKLQPMDDRILRLLLSRALRPQRYAGRISRQRGSMAGTEDI